MSDINKVTELLTNYTKFRGLIMHMSIISEASKEINLTRLSIFIFIINILNQLRGIVIYQNDTMIVTKFKHEVQCVICLPAALLNEIQTLYVYRVRVFNNLAMLKLNKLF